MDRASSAEWTRCGGCGLGHRPRPDGRCPRCGAVVEPLPLVEDVPLPLPVHADEAVSPSVVDPAVWARPSPPPPARLRAPAVLASLAALAVAATALLTDAPMGYAVAGAGLALAALTIGALARA